MSLNASSAISFAARWRSSFALARRIRTAMSVPIRRLLKCWRLGRVRRGSMPWCSRCPIGRCSASSINRARWRGFPRSMRRWGEAFHRTLSDTPLQHTAPRTGWICSRWRNWWGGDEVWGSVTTPPDKNHGQWLPVRKKKGSYCVKKQLLCQWVRRSCRMSWQSRLNVILVCYLLRVLFFQQIQVAWDWDFYPKEDYAHQL